jgi:SH3-like domain-containing protein
VRRAAGVESADDPQLDDGAPVLVSAGGGLQIGGHAWRAVRGLSGVVGWVPGAQVVVDGEASPIMVAAAQAPTPMPGANGGSGSTGERMRVANTDGVGVVLRNSPRDADKTPRGLMDGANVSVLERNGSDWVHVRVDNGQDGWVPARYVVPAP